MEKLKVYSFKQLESFLNDDDNENKALILKNESQSCTAIMHVFRENFCGDWVSGDGILFYSDGETHSAGPNDDFLLIDIITY